ncbi:MAG: hypothetical protein ABEJ06_06805 [Haloarculaceae archaeon]
MTVYRGSDGGYYTDADVIHHLEREDWTVHSWEPVTGAEVFETADGERLKLQPVDGAELPEGVELVTLDGEPGDTVVDRRR